MLLFLYPKKLIGIWLEKTNQHSFMLIAKCRPSALSLQHRACKASARANVENFHIYRDFILFGRPFGRIIFPNSNFWFNQIITLLCACRRESVLQILRV